MTTKICSKCKIEQSTSEFYKRATTNDGLAQWCKSCRSKYFKKRWKEDPAFRKRQIKYTNEYIKKRKQEDREFAKNYNELVYKYQICKIIRNHHEELKDDPEHLTTEFIQSIMGVKCGQDQR